MPRPGVAIFVPGLNAGGGAEKTALRMALALRDLDLDVECWTDSAIDRTHLGLHFGLELEGIRFTVLPGAPRMATRAPRALVELARDWKHWRAIRATTPELFVNLKFKSSLPGAGRTNWYYVHFPHRVAIEARSAPHRVYLSLVRLLRRCLLNRGNAVFIDTYDVVMANSEFTARHVLDRWGVAPTTLYPPCETAGAVSTRSRERIILSVGRFQAPGSGIPHKSQHVLIDAFARLGDLADQGWELHMVGALSDRAEDVAYHAELCRMAAELPVTIHANASHQSLVDLAERSTFYWHAQGYGTDSRTHPEAQEHFGISTVESMAAGCVPLVYATAGPLEVVEEVSSELGWDSVSELISVTRRLASKSDLDTLRSSCVARSQNFSEDAFAARVAREWGLSLSAASANLGRGDGAQDGR